jgi:hypothetical protein
VYNFLPVRSEVNFVCVCYLIWVINRNRMPDCLRGLSVETLVLLGSRHATNGLRCRRIVLKYCAVLAQKNYSQGKI